MTEVWVPKPEVNFWDKLKAIFKSKVENK